MTLRVNSIKIILIPTIFLCMYITTSVSTEGISCFKCYASQPGTEQTDLLCSQFDGSARFQVYCPSSTLCRKKTIYYKLKTSIITAVERDCAPQKRMIPIYSNVDNKWQNTEEIVKTAYREDCFAGEDRGAPGGPPEYCFCSYHLCNSSRSIKAMYTYHIFALITILLFAKLT